MSSALLFVKFLWNKKQMMLLGCLAACGILFYAYYSYASNKIDSYVSKNLELTKIIEEKDKLLTTLKENYDKIIASKDALMKEMSAVDMELNSLKNKLFRENRNKKSLGELATKKTSLIEKTINKATKEVFKCFETLSKNGDC